MLSRFFRRVHLLNVLYDEDRGDNLIYIQFQLIAENERTNSSQLYVVNHIIFVENMKVKVAHGIDGSARKPAFVQDTNYMVEKTYHIARYFGAFGAYLMPQ